ncbi:sugar nucleotide-binding protein [Propionibacteriaceae bacterium Y1685]
MRLLVVGGSGTLGRALVARADPAHEVWATHASNPVAGGRARWHHLDVREPDVVTELVGRVRPDVIINTVSLPSSWEVTALGPARVATAAAAVGARVVQISSDAVFAGRESPYRPHEHPDPRTPYGAAKAAAEVAVAAVAQDHLIVRTSLIIGDDAATEHERLIHRRVADPATGSLFTDDVRCPVHVDDLADAVLELGHSEHRGVLHVAGAEAISRYDLGRLVAARDGLDAAALRGSLRRTSGVPGPVQVVLDSTSAQAQINTRLRGASEFLRS